jgi:TatA/E family protein of Tat protein translocase
VPSLGPLEILVVFIVALLVFGPNKLPELARQVGKGLAEFRRVQHHLRSELDDAIHSVMDDDKPTVAPVVTEPPPQPVEGGPPARPVDAITAESSEANEAPAPPPEPTPPELTPPPQADEPS